MYSKPFFTHAQNDRDRERESDKRRAMYVAVWCERAREFYALWLCAQTRVYHSIHDTTEFASYKFSNWIFFHLLSIPIRFRNGGLVCECERARNDHFSHRIYCFEANSLAFMYFFANFPPSVIHSFPSTDSSTFLIANKVDLKFEKMQQWNLVKTIKLGSMQRIAKLFNHKYAFIMWTFKILWWFYIQCVIHQIAYSLPMAHIQYQATLQREKKSAISPDWKEGARNVCLCPFLSSKLRRIEPE